MKSPEFQCAVIMQLMPQEVIDARINALLPPPDAVDVTEWLHMDMDHARAQFAGALACLADVPLVPNPHPCHQVKREGWDDGWKQAAALTGRKW